MAVRGFSRGNLLQLGVLAYGVYNYLFYLFGASLNAFLPLYVACVLVSGVALARGMTAVRIDSLARSFDYSTPVRLIGAGLMLIAL